MSSIPDSGSRERNLNLPDDVDSKPSHWGLMIRDEGSDMLHDLTEWEGFIVRATDGLLGTVSGFYFDDKHWVIRYLLVETEQPFRRGRRVAISPAAVKRGPWDRDALHVDLRLQQVMHSPSIEIDQCVSHSREVEFHDYYGYPYYWTREDLRGPHMDANSSPATTPDHARRMNAPRGEVATDPGGGPGAGGNRNDRPQLRSTTDAMNLEATASDGAIGCLQSVVFDDESWSILCLIVDAANWLPGERVLVASNRIQRIDWPAHTVYLDITRHELETTPPYTRQSLSPRQRAAGWSCASGTHAIEDAF
jgi:hypothetical protein